MRRPDDATQRTNARTYYGTSDLLRPRSQEFVRACNMVRRGQDDGGHDIDVKQQGNSVCYFRKWVDLKKNAGDKKQN